MELFVIRHAVAEDARSGQPDASRALTADGTRRFRRVVRGMRALGWRFECVYTSPWKRAAQTAELVAPISHGDPIASDLLCDRPRAELLALVAAAGAAESRSRAVAVVGHEPWLGELASWLAFGDPRHAHAFQLKKGGVVWLDGEAAPGAMLIRAIVPPKLLRRLA
jgi:phosphohistidine phosphatase